jgi:hypothetical protein
MDCKKDVPKPMIGLLPIYNELLRPILDNVDYEYKFGIAPKVRTDHKGPKFIPYPNRSGTGFEGYTLFIKGRWSITVYNKLLENSQYNRNALKKNAYDNFYQDEEFITRVEIELDGEENNRYITEKYRNMFEEKKETETFILGEVLKRFYSKRRVYLIESPKDLKKRNNKLKEEPRWKEFFNPKDEKIILTKAEKVRQVKKSDKLMAKRYLKTSIKKFISEKTNKKEMLEIFDELEIEMRKEAEEMDNTIDKTREGLELGNDNEANGESDSDSIPSPPDGA